MFIGLGWVLEESIGKTLEGKRSAPVAREQLPCAADPGQGLVHYFCANGDWDAEHVRGVEGGGGWEMRLIILEKDLENIDQGVVQ
jgi:hypothetical protein